MSDELERLRQENRTLNEQIKLLVQTEQRLYRARNEIDTQLFRVRQLGEFALRYSSSEPASEILGRALKLLTGLFAADLVMALNAPHGSGPTELYTRTPGARRVEGPIAVPEGVVEWARSHEQTALLPAGLPLPAVLLDALPPPLRSLLDAGDVTVVCRPLRGVSGEFFGCLFAAQRSQHFGQGFKYKPALGETELPFLALLADHLERALQNTALTRQLQERGDELVQSNWQLTESLARLEQTQEQLLQARKMEAIGRLAGGVAHDFNNLLTVILGHAELLKCRIPELSDTRRDLANIIEAGNRAAEIVGQLLAFSRKQRTRPESVDVNELVQGMARMLGRLIGETIAMRVKIAVDAGSIRADRSQAEQIVMNLVVNARDAMPDGGELTIKTRFANDDDLAGIEDGDADAADGYVVIEVSDTGHGMDEAIRTQIFEPFFTTKEVGQGTGMGLATVYGLVRQNDGFILVDSRIGEGSRFTVLLPASRESADEVAAMPERAASDAKATLLLAEDERGIRVLFERVLRSEGYEVLVASDGLEGRDLAAARLAEIDLVICDVVMPKVGGVEMVRQLRERRPELLALFISGYAFESFAESDLVGEPYLQKPIRPDELLDRVRELLQRGRLRAVRD